MDNRKIEIRMTGHGYGSVFIDGEEIAGVVSASFSVGVGRANSVTLELCAKEILVTGEAKVTFVSPENPNG